MRAIDSGRVHTIRIWEIQGRPTIVTLSFFGDSHMAQIETFTEPRLVLELIKTIK